MAVPFESRFFSPKKPKPSEDLWREYALNQDGILSYDAHLYRIRSWSIVLNGVLLAGYLGINLGSSQTIDPGAAIAALAVVTLGFWMLDALNKSLQMVYVYAARDIEQLMRGESSVRVGPATSLRFQKKQGNHFKSIIKNIMEESVWPFYVLPLLSTSVMITSSSYINNDCARTEVCVINPSAYLACAALAIVLAVVGISLAARARIIRHLLLSWYPSAKTKAFHAEIAEQLPFLSSGAISLVTRETYAKFQDGKKVTHILYNHRVGPYKMNLYWENLDGCGAIFMNSKKREEDWEYRKNRENVFSENFVEIKQCQVPYKGDFLRKLLILGVSSIVIFSTLMVPAYVFINWWNS